eukprot:Skav220394  [mRNA]  locus=scaffold639:248658:258388:- [translate_table: standard]
MVRMVHNCPGVLGDHSKRLLECAISQQGTTQRWRDLLPLPVPDDVVDTVKAMTESRETKLKKSGASGGAVRNTYRKLGADALVYCMTVGLNCLWGGLKSKTREPTLWRDVTPAQEMAVERLKEAALYLLDGKDVDGGTGVPRTPDGDWNDRIDDARISYHGEVMLKAEPLELERVVVSLPPEGFGAVVNILDVCEGKIRDQLSDPHSLILGAHDLPEAIPKPRVRVLDGEWEPLARSLVERGILVPTPEVLQFKGEMVLNGLFGVEKSNKPIPDGRSSQRLIMDLRASNAMLSVIGGDIGTLSGASAFTAITLEEGNVISISGDDLVASFYLFSLPPVWRPFLAFEKPVSWRALGYDRDGSTYLSSAVLPMGFSSSVGIMQHIHRRLALWSPRAGAGLNAALEVRRDRPWPELGDDCPAWCLYLDDSTLLRKIEAQVAETLVGKSQQEQDDLRRAYQYWGIPFNSKKAVEECLSAERLGAYLDGDRGRIGVTAKRTLECLGLSAWVLGQGQVSKKTLQVLAGKEIHCLQFRRPLMSVYDEIWKLIAGPEDYPYLTVKLVNEIVTSMCLSPLRFTDWRAGIDPQVMASDASESGGGFVMASKLSESGVALVLKPDERQKTRTGVVVFDFFAGIGGLLRSLERAGLEWEHHVVIESDRQCRRCIRRTWPSASEYTDVQTLTREDMARELDKVENLGLVVAGGGSPCQGLSKLSSQRQHFKDARSKLFFDFSERVEELKSLVAERDAEFLGFMENVVMDEADRDEVTDRLGWKPHLLESGDISRVRRPRLYWMNQTLPMAEWFEIEYHDLVNEVKMKGEIEPDAFWVPEGLKFHGDPKVKLPTFTRPIKRSRPPVDPAGLKGSTKDARERWLKDQFRYPPYTYEKKLMLADAQGNLHKVAAQSREALMGYPVGHTRKLDRELCFKMSFEASEDLRQAAIGNSFHTGTVALLLGTVLHQMGWLSTVRDPEMLLSALVVEYEEFETPGSMAPSPAEEPVDSPTSPLSSLELDEELLQLNCVQDDIDQVALNRQLMTALVAQFLRRVEYRGSDIRLDSEVLFKPGQCPRTSIDPSKWEWKHCRAFRWRHTAHINLLELKALTHAIQWRARRSKFHSFRTMLLCDSQSVVAVVAKGRSSSKKVNHLLRKISKQQRKDERAQLGRLADLVVKPGTLNKYHEHFNRFYQWAIANEFTTATAADLDGAASQYLEALWADGFGRSEGSYLLASLQFMVPTLKHQLPLSWRLLKTWQKHELPTRAVPLDALTVLAFSGLFCVWQEPRLAAGILVAFDLSLRTGELFTIQRQQVEFLGNTATVQLLQTKSSGHQIHSERLLIWDRTALQALRFLCHRLQPGDYLIASSAQRFRTLWHRAVDYFLLQDFYIQPYSLRRGGATSAFRRGITFEQLLLRGRWSHQRTARLYLDEALQQSSQLSFSTRSKTRLAWARRHLSFNGSAMNKIDTLNSTVALLRQTVDDLKPPEAGGGFLCGATSLGSRERAVLAMDSENKRRRVAIDGENPPARAAMKLRVSLPSGQTASIGLPPNSTVGDLKVAAQQSLRHRFLRLMGPDATLLNPAESRSLLAPSEPRRAVTVCSRFT